MPKGIEKEGKEGMEGKEGKEGKEEKNEVKATKKDRVVLNDTDAITLECLISRHCFKKLFDNQDANAHKSKKMQKDKQFYRKRILDLCKTLLLEKEAEEEGVLGVEPVNYQFLVDSFSQFVHLCIRHFKTIDHSDILQSDYKDMDSQTQLQTQTHGEQGFKEIDYNAHLLQTTKHVSLDDFVIKKPLPKKHRQKMILPMKKKVNLKDPELKVKGIVGKKNNIDIKYEDKADKTEGYEEKDV
jgi:hypothetical protein